MTRSILLIDIGADPLPAVTPVSRPAANWVPPLQAAVEIPPADNVAATPAADSITITWDASPLPGAMYLVWRAPDVDGVPGAWTYVTRTTATRYTYTDASGAKSWWKITVEVNGISSGDSSSVSQAPVPTTAQLLAAQQAIDQEIADRLEGDLQAVQTAADDATAKADAARDAAIAHADAIGAAVADILDADEWSEVTTYPSGDFVQRAGKLYRALRANTNAAPESSPDDWELVGNYASVGEAVAAAVDLGNQAISDVQAQSSRLQAVEARMPTGTGGLATSASVVDEATARAQQDQALGQRIGVVETALPGKADASALTALQGQVTTQGNTLTAQGSALTAVKASMPAGSGNLIPNAAFEADLSGWSTGWSTNGKGASYVRDAGGASFVPTGCHTIGIQPSGATTGVAYLDGPTIAIDPSKRYCYSGYLMSQRAGASIRLFAITWDNHETELSPDSESEIWPADATYLPDWTRQAIFYQPTSAVRYLRVSFRQYATGGSDPFSSLCRPMLEVASADQTAPSAWAPSAAGIDSKYASVTQSMQAQVTSQGNDIATNAQNILGVQSALPGKADASALTALQDQVTQQGDTITAQGSALTAVKASMPAGSGNLIPNAAFEADLSGWSTGWSTNGKGASYVRDAGGASFVPTGCHTIGIQPSGATTGVAYLDGPTIAIDPSKRYCYSGYLMSQRAGASIRLFAITWDNHETELSPDAESEIAPTDPTYLPGWQRQAIFYQPTSAVRYLKVSFRQNAAGDSAPFSSLCRPMLEVASADQTAPSAWAPSAAGIDSKYASVTQSMQAQVTSQGNNIASILAQYFLAVNAGGKIAGMKIGSNGTTGSVEFLADIFRIVTDGSIGLEWQGSYLRAYSSGFQYIIGPGFGPGNTYVMWFGPNVGVAACTDALAISFAKVDGLQQTSGTLVAGLLAGSAMELGSTRIHTGGGRLAPFIVKDAKYYVSPGTNASRTLVLDGFVGPSSGTGYHSKRFAAQRMDVWLDVQISGDTGTETAILEVAYDGNSTWTQITSVSFNCDYRGSFPLMVRYTTVDTWGSVAFRVRTTQNRTEAMRITAEIINANSSANDAGSSSNTTGGGGATPINPNPWCVDYETTVLPDGRFVRDLRPGDLAECVDVPTGTREWIALRAIAFGEADCYAVRTAHGEVIQSDTTPMVMRDGSIVLTPDLDDCELLTHAHGFERARIERIGRRKVVKVDFGNRMFFSGTRPDNAIATHNIKMTEP